MANQIAFLVFSVVVVFAAWRVVSTPDVGRAAVALVVVLAGMAPLFILLAAEFVAVVQVLVYVGAVIVLFLFALMLTSHLRRDDVGTDAYEGRGVRRWPGASIAIAFCAALVFAVRDAFGDVEVEPASVGRTADVGNVLLRDHVIAFEAVSVLLLAALVGAMVIARRS